MKEQIFDTVKTSAVLGTAYLASDAPIDIEGVSNTITAVGQALIAVLGAVYAVVRIFKGR